jgi:hypothetical protein
MNSQRSEDLHIHVSNFCALGKEKSQRYDSYKTPVLENTKLTATRRINNPFHGWKDSDVERVAKRLAIWYGAPEDVFVRVGKVCTLQSRFMLTISRLRSHSLNPHPGCGMIRSYPDSQSEREHS